MAELANILNDMGMSLKAGLSFLSILLLQKDANIQEHNTFPADTWPWLSVVILFL